MKKAIIILITITIFLSGCTSKPKLHSAAPNSLSATDMMQKCKQEIAELEKYAASEKDLDKKANMCNMASVKAINCFTKASKEFPNSNDIIGIGSDKYHEATNYLCYCESTIAAKEIKIDAEKDPIKKFDLLNDKLAFSIGCIKSFQSAIFESPISPGIGNDDLGITTNIEVNCKKIINTLKSQIDKKKECKDKKEPTTKMFEIEQACMRMAHSVIADPRRAPQLQSNYYGTDKYYKEAKKCNDDKGQAPYLIWVDDGLPPPKIGSPSTIALISCLTGVNRKHNSLLKKCTEKYGEPAIDASNYPDLAECYTDDPEYSTDAWKCQGIADAIEDKDDTKVIPTIPKKPQIYTNTKAKFDCIMKSTPELKKMQKVCLEKFSVLERPTAFTDCLEASKGYTKASSNLTSECTKKAQVPIKK